jgi:hypothetical protein
MIFYAAEKDNHYFVVLLSWQPVSRHVNVAPLGITCFPCTVSLSSGESDLGVCRPAHGKSHGNNVTHEFGKRVKTPPKSA